MPSFHLLYPHLERLSCLFLSFFFPDGSVTACMTLYYSSLTSPCPYPNLELFVAKVFILIIFKSP